MRAKLKRGKIPNVVLIGATGSGKTTVSIQLAQLLGFGVIDLDHRIEKHMGKTIAELFEHGGVQGFRDEESLAIDGLDGVLNHVIVPGAGALEREENFVKLKKLGPLVWLATPSAAIVNRLVMKPDELRQRPLLAAAVTIEDKEERSKFLFDIIDEKMKGRVPIYSRADLVLDSSYATSEINASLIKGMLLKWGSLQ